MKLRILSDLHNEFSVFDPPPVECDVVVLAGDIDVGIKAIEWAGRTFADKPVVFVHGNHEFYRGDFDLIEKCRQAAPDNVHVLEKDSVVIGGTRFVGTTLWTDFCLMGEAEQFLSMQHAGACLTDFSVIRHSGEPFTPRKSVELHDQSVKWLDGELANEFDGQTVVVTHHAPSPLSVAPQFKTDVVSAAFASNLESLIAVHRPALWIHGHTHDPFDYAIHDTRVVCNPRGYPQENRDQEFDPSLVVEIP